MTDTYIVTPDGSKLDADQRTVSGQIVKVQFVMAGPNSYILEASFTRPADAIAYAADDAVTNSTSAPVALTFPNAARGAGLGGEIRWAQMVCSVNPGTKGNFELYIFNGPSAPAPDNDNAAFTPTDAELLKVVPKIIFHSNNAFAGDAASNCLYDGTMSNGADAQRALSIPYVCDPATTSLFGLLKVKGAYTPSSAETFSFRLGVWRN
jgi:hypothetical protein